MAKTILRELWEGAQNILEREENWNGNSSFSGGRYCLYWALRKVGKERFGFTYAQTDWVLGGHRVRNRLARINNRMGYLVVKAYIEMKLRHC